MSKHHAIRFSYVPPQLRLVSPARPVWMRLLDNHTLSTCYACEWKVLPNFYHSDANVHTASKLRNGRMMSPTGDRVFLRRRSASWHDLLPETGVHQKSSNNHLTPNQQTGNPGDILPYTFMITNQDTIGCPTATFQLTPHVDRDWKGYSDSSVTVSAGQTVRLSTKFQSSTLARPGNYPITILTRDTSSTLHDTNTSAAYIISAPTPTPTPIPSQSVEFR